MNHVSVVIAMDFENQLNSFHISSTLFAIDSRSAIRRKYLISPYLAKEFAILEIIVVLKVRQILIVMELFILQGLYF